MATSALAVAEKKVELGLVKSHGAVILADQLQQVTEQRKLLVKFVHENLREDVDFGTIPGTPKPCLYKPGAEKLTDLYRCTVEFEVDKETEDWEKGFFYYRIRARIVSRETGVCLGVGLGSCNSHETKYRWRDGKTKCPTCQAETIFKSKEKPEWFCWAKKGGCGAIFPLNAPAIVDQPRGRVENPDIADLVNTIQKMSTKRAHVAAALQLAGCSDLFTQDLEDMPRGEELPPMPRPASQVVVEQPPAQQQAKPAAQPNAGQLRVRLAKLWSIAQKHTIDKDAFQSLAREVLGVDKPSNQWTAEEVSKMEEAMKE